MTRHDSVRANGGWIAAVVLAGYATAMAAPASPPPPDLQGEVERQMFEIQNNLTNASARLKSAASGNASSMGGPPSAGSHPCCGQNIQNIRRAVDSLRESLGRLRACHADADRIAAMTAVDAAVADLGEFARWLEAFDAAGTLSDAGPALYSLTRPWIQLRDDVYKVEACSPAQASPETGKKKRGRKGSASGGNGPGA